MTARDSLTEWLSRSQTVLDVGDQRAPMGPGGLVIGGLCWKCNTTQATIELGVCDACLSWLRCEDLLEPASSAATPATSSTTEP